MSRLSPRIKLVVMMLVGMLAGPLLRLGSWPQLFAASTTIKYTYNEFGRLIKAAYANGWSLTYTYDPAGNLLSRTVSVSEAGLYLPFYQATAGTFVGFAISNFSNQTADLEFTAYSDSGALASFPRNPSTRSLPAGNQLALLGSEIFGTDSLVPHGGWVYLSSSTQELGGFFMVGNYTLTELDGSVATKGQATELYFTRAYEGAEAFHGRSAKTWLSLANPNETSVDLDLKLFGPSTPGNSPPNPVLATKAVTLAAKGYLYQSISQLFGTGVSGGHATASVSQGPGVVGFQLIQFPAQPTVIGLNASYPNPGREAYSAQFAHGSVIFTNLSLLNGAPQVRQVTVKAIKEDGSQLGNSFQLVLQPGERVEKDAGALVGLGAETLAVGSLQVSADGPGVMGDVIFGNPADLSYAASMPLQTTGFTKAVFSQVANTVGMFTGLALYNPGTSPAQFKIEVFSELGVSTGRFDGTLPVGQRISRLVDELVPSTAGQIKGYIVITTNQPLIAQQLFGGSSLNMLAAVPPTVVH